MPNPTTAAIPTGLNHWIITRDLEAQARAKDGERLCNFRRNDNAPGVMSRHCPIEIALDDLRWTQFDEAADRIAIAAKKAGMTLRFRLQADGDSEGEFVTFYEGYMVPFEAHGPNADGFEPLDHFGRSNAGATYLEYWVPGKGGGWKAL